METSSNTTSNNASELERQHTMEVRQISTQILELPELSDQEIEIDSAVNDHESDHELGNNGHED